MKETIIESLWTGATVKEQISNFLDDCRARRLSPRTVVTYSLHLQHLLKWADLNQVDELRQLTPGDIRNYMVHCQQPGFRGRKSPHTFHGAFRVLKTFLRFNVTEGVIQSNPIDNIRAPKLPQRILPAMTDDDVKAVIDHWSDWERKPVGERSGWDAFQLRNLALFYFMLDTGLRVEEVTKCKTEDVDLDSGRVFVRSGKGDKQRLTFIGKKTIEYLKKYLKLRKHIRSDSLWHGNNGKLTVSGIQTLFRKVEYKTGVKVSPHRIRRTFAINMLRNGADLYRLRDLMGHSDIRTLERYLAMDERDLAEIHKKCGPVSGMQKMSRDPMLYM